MFWRPCTQRTLQCWAWATREKTLARVNACEKAVYCLQTLHNSPIRELLTSTIDASWSDFTTKVAHRSWSPHSQACQRSIDAEHPRTSVRPTIDPSRICPPQSVTLDLPLLFPCRYKRNFQMPMVTWGCKPRFAFSCVNHAERTRCQVFAPLFPNWEPTEPSWSSQLVLYLRRSSLFYRNSSRCVFSRPPETPGHSSNSPTFGIG